MPLRNILLGLMLGSLAVCGVFGVLAVLFGAAQTTDRIVGSGVPLAVTFFVMLVVSFLIDKPMTRWAGIVGVASSGIGAALLLSLIWSDLFFGRNWQTTDSVLASSWAMIGFGATAACSLVGFGVVTRWWRWIGVVASGAAICLGVFFVWTRDSVARLPFAIVAEIAVIVAYANLIFLCSLQRGQQWVRWGTFAAVIAGSILVNISAARPTSFGDPDDLLTRAIAAVAIAAGCGTLALLALTRLNRKATKPTLPAGVKELSIVCPWCSQKQTLPLGASSCGGCGLKFQIAVEEPHCPNCDYLLYMLSSNRCPECGTVVLAQAEGWRAVSCFSVATKPPIDRR